MENFGSANLNIMINAAKKAGKSLLRDFLEVENLQASLKGPADFVSAADLRADKIIRDELSASRPNFGILTEESGMTEGKDTSHRFIVDPLDGTSNFLHGIPLFAVSIALEENREIVAGVTYLPVSDELFYAEKGQGAFFFGGPRRSGRMRVSKRKELEVSLMRVSEASFPSSLETMNSRTLLKLGASAIELAYIAAGKCEAFAHKRAKIWDIAAGAILVKEAGGNVDIYNEDGKLEDDKNSILISNGVIKNKLLEKIKY
jgi:myo-inositol-1(or 4)-monophosphatase